MTAPSPTTRGRAFPRGLVLRLALSAVLVWVLVMTFDLDSTYVRGRSLDVSWLLVGVSVLLGQTLLAAVRWQIVIDGLGLVASRAQSYRILLVGLFFNQTLPSSIGGDAVRIWQLRSLGNRGADATTAVLLDRVIALVALLPLMIGGLLRLAGHLQESLIAPTVAVITGLTIAGLTVLLLLHRLPGHLLTGRAFALRTMSASSLAFLREPVRIASTTLLAVVIHLITGFSVYALARSADVALSLNDALLLTPLVLLVISVPISFAGWGLREGAMIVVLGVIGIAKADALALSVLFGLSVMFTGIPGGMLWLVGRRSQPRTMEPQAREARS